MVYCSGMTEMSKAPSDREIAAAREITEAQRARRMAARAHVERLTARGRSLQQAKRSDLAKIALILGHTVTTSTTRTALVALIEAEI